MRSETWVLDKPAAQSASIFYSFGNSEIHWTQTKQNKNKTPLSCVGNSRENFLYSRYRNSYFVFLFLFLFFVFFFNFILFYLFFFFFLNFILYLFIFIGVQLLNNVVLVSAVQQSEPVTCIFIFTPFLDFLPI